MTHSFPRQIYESNLPKVLEALGRLDECDEPLEIDLAEMHFWIPAAIVAVCAMARRWHERGREITFSNLSKCKSIGYLQRMNFFNQIGLELPEAFKRHDPGTSFVEIERIYPTGVRDSDELARKLGSCLSGTENVFDEGLRFAEFSIGELIANCQQHAQSSGFVSAQYIQSRDWARIGIADDGIGIRESFRDTKSGYFKEGMTDAEALEMAMTPWVSSKTHLYTAYGPPSNRGIGLKMVWNMLNQAGGVLFIASGNAWRFYTGNTVKLGELATRFPGTVVSLLFERGQIDDYAQILEEAQRAVDLTSDPDDRRLFQ